MNTKGTITVDFGQELRNLIKARGIKFVTFAKKMDVSPAYLSQLVTGIRRPGRETLLKLSTSLDVPVDTLIRMGANKYEQILTVRNVPVLEITKISQWLDESASNGSSFLADTFEYATTDDSGAFYVRSEELKSCCGLEEFDLILIEPSKEVQNGNTVLVCSPEGCSLMKVAIKDNMMLLFNGKKEPIIYSPENNTEGLRLCRAKESVKKL